MSISNSGAVDLESVLNVRRRTLASIGELGKSHQQPHYTDTIYVKREDNSYSIFSINSKVLVFGELQLLYTIFERFSSNITVHEDSNTDSSPSSPVASVKPIFSPTLEENEPDEEGPPIVSTLRHTTISSTGSASPPEVRRGQTRTPGSPTRKKTLGSIGRSLTSGSTSSDYSLLNLEGKRYGSIELPNMTMIEILEILLRNGLELLHVTSDYDEENVLHQNFVFSKIRKPVQKLGQTLTRSASVVGT